MKYKKAATTCITDSVEFPLAHGSNPCRAANFGPVFLDGIHRGQDFVLMFHGVVCVHLKLGC
jgi:hypothetical protein